MNRNEIRSALDWIFNSPSPRETIPFHAWGNGYGLTLIKQNQQANILLTYKKQTIMTNFSKTSVAQDTRVELHDVLNLTGAEVSINNLPAGTAGLHLRAVSNAFF